jgi:hypothetical protein
LWSFTGLPVIIAEFGYISSGAPKTEDERAEVLHKFGYESEFDCREHIDEFITKLPSNLQNSIKGSLRTDSPQAQADCLFGYMMKDHIYREMPANVVIKNFPHTRQGQADFYSYIIPRMAKKPYIIGMFVYCWSDSARCYVCGFEDCPIETAWGLVNYAQEPKPSYYAVRDAFNAIRQFNR